ERWALLPPRYGRRQTRRARPRPSPPMPRASSLVDTELQPRPWAKSTTDLSEQHGRGCRAVTRTNLIRCRVRGPRELAFVAEQDALQVQAAGGCGDACIAAVSGSDRLGDGAFREPAAGDIDEGADEDAHHVVHEGVSLDVDLQDARVGEALR